MSNNNSQDKTSDVAIAGFVLSILGLVCCMLPYCSVFISILAMILCIDGIRKRPKKDLGIVGIIISSLALISSIIFTILWLDENSLYSVITEPKTSQYDNDDSDSDSDSTYLDYALDKRSEPLTTKISNYDEVKIGDNIYTMPIDYAEFEDKLDISDLCLEIVENKLRICDAIGASMYIKEYKSEYYIDLYNFKELYVTDVKDLTIGSISTDIYYDSKKGISYIGDMEIYGGIRIGSTKEEVLEVLGEPVYVWDAYLYRNDEDGIYEYEFDEISIELTIINGIVTHIDISYYQNMQTILGV